MTRIAATGCRLRDARHVIPGGLCPSCGMLSCTHDRAAQEATSLDALAEIERRVLWLATAIVHHANRVRPNPGGLKVGGHQASSASMVTIMTALWFEHLRAEDRVSVKPHASPVLHAINYLLGELDESYLTTLRAFGGLQSYPSRAKDPDPVDYSTGSVGIGATAPIWGAMARRYVETLHAAPRDRGRQYSLVGDAELDEGAVWEAVSTPASPSSARSSGSSTSTGSRSTGWCPTSPPTGCRACSPPPAGRCSP